MSMKLKYTVHFREVTASGSTQGIRLPKEFGEPKGVWRWMPNGGFIAADTNAPVKLRNSIDIFRWLAFCQPVEIADGLLVVPRLYQRMGLLPKYGEPLVLFGAEDWCEMWPRDKFIEHIRGTAADLNNLMARVEDELAERR